MIGYDQFWKEMELCRGTRSDGKVGKCIDASKHNLGCWTCPVANGLFEPSIAKAKDVLVANIVRNIK